MDRVYVDTEYYFRQMSPTSGRPTDADERWIAQIGAIRVDTKTGVEHADFDELIRPRVGRRIPDYFFTLTGLTVEEMKRRGRSYLEGLLRFFVFSQGAEIWTFDADERVFRQNCGLYRVRFPFEHHPFVRVKPKLAGWGIDPNSYSSGTLYQAAGLTMEGHVHNALFDVRSMAAAVHVFEHRT